MLAVDPAEVPSRPLLRHLLCDVATLPRSVLPAGHGHLSISVLFSPPRQHKLLYPWAHLDGAREIASGSKPYPSNHDAVQTWEEMVFFHAEWRGDDEDPDDARMICAIEGYNYTLPGHGSGVFYLSKLDTTGYSPRLNNPRTAKHLAKHDVPFVPSHATSTKFGSSSGAAPGADPSSSSSAASLPTSLTTHLTTSFLTYFLRLSHHPRLPVPSRPLRHMSLHILARAQGAYLFPNSPDNPRKKPLSDTKLIVWWREVLSRVIQTTKTREWDARIDARYMVPGMDAFESHPLVPLPPRGGDSPLARAEWKYGHPYTLQGAQVAREEDLPPLPLHLDPTRAPPRFARSLASLIPRFEDDPQSRFLDELAEDGQEPGRFPGLFQPKRGSGAAANGLKRKSTSKSPEAVGDAGVTTTSSSSSPPSSLSPRKSQRTTQRASPVKTMATRSTPASTPTPTPVSRPESPLNLRRSPRKSRGDCIEGREGDDRAGPTAPRRSRSASSSSARVAASAAATGRRVTNLAPSAPPPPPPASGRLTTVQINAIRARLSLDAVSPDDFWIRMGFRQECSSGNLVGAFFLSATYDRGGNDPTASENENAATTTLPSPPLAIPPQPRPRFTIPHPSLYKCMRNNLQLDDCYWDKPREAIELTQEFDEQRGRLLMQFGSLAEHERIPSESGYDEDIDITLHTVRGISSGGPGGGRMLRKTRNKRSKNSGAVNDNTSGDAPAARPAMSAEEAAEEERMQQEYVIGKGVVWQTIPLRGYDEKMVQDAKVLADAEREKEAPAGVAMNVANGGGAAPTVTTLTVKRRKKRET